MAEKASLADRDCCEPAHGSSPRCRRTDVRHSTGAASFHQLCGQFVQDSACTAQAAPAELCARAATVPLGSACPSLSVMQFQMPTSMPTSGRLQRTSRFDRFITKRSCTHLTVLATRGSWRRPSCGRRRTRSRSTPLIAIAKRLPEVRMRRGPLRPKPQPGLLRIDEALCCHWKLAHLGSACLRCIDCSNWLGRLIDAQSFLKALPRSAEALLHPTGNQAIRFRGRETPSNMHGEITTVALRCSPRR